jgi:pimeloyl-ACP methyl ester carboxylesterase
MRCVLLRGAGLSDHPKFTARSTAESERFFTDALERWRLAMCARYHSASSASSASAPCPFDSLTIAAHSFGGYVSACYALHYPKSVARLVLLSPVGVSASNHKEYVLFLHTAPHPS